MALIELENVARSYLVGGEALQVLKGVSLTIEEGEFVAIMGPSGSGKSTLMQILGLLDRPSGGTYRLMGRDVSNLSDDEGAALRSKTIGFIFQMFNLLARTSTLDNVALPMIYSGAPGRDERATELLVRVGLGDRLDHAPNQLSGGQQQRVAIARALVNRPRILFADEPTGNLASDQAEDILRLIESLNREGITVIMVTHEPDIAAHARRIIRIKDGRVVADERRDGAAPPVGARAAPPPAGAESDDSSLAAMREYAASAMRAMAANKARSALSMLGILIGVAAVIAMLAIGAGAQKAIEARLASLGSNLVMVFARPPNMNGIVGGSGIYSRLTLDDAKSVRSVPGVVDIYPEAEGNVQIVYGNQNWNTEMQGVTPSYESIRNSTPYYGRFFTAAEDQAQARYVLLGQTVVKQLFGTKDPVGQTVEISHIAFKVIGLLPIKGSNGNSDQDDLIVVPITTAMKRVLGTLYLHEMAAQCASPEAIDGVILGIQALLRRRHRLPAYKDDDFTLRNMAAAAATLQGTTKTMSLLLSIVAAISLLVGGVGIMNILLVSVNERTREIGLRKAVGASRRAIMSQFLIESLALSACGGLLGVALGTSISLALSAFAGWAAVVSLKSVLVAFGFSAGVGVVFGLWPARKAALLSPIEALRYE
jgi:macrolide transport system ATP-binding/permease protein